MGFQNVLLTTVLHKSAKAQFINDCEKVITFSDRNTFLHYQSKCITLSAASFLLHYQVILLHYQVFVLHDQVVTTLTGNYYSISCDLCRPSTTHAPLAICRSLQYSNPRTRHRLGRSPASQCPDGCGGWLRQTSTQPTHCLQGALKLSQLTLLVRRI